MYKNRDKNKVICFAKPCILFMNVNFNKSSHYGGLTVFAFLEFI